MNKSKKGMYGALAFDLAGAGYATAVLCLDAASPYVAVPCAAICRLCVATESPSGKVTRPSQYLRTVPREEVLVQDREPAEGAADCAVEMLAYLVAEKPTACDCAEVER